VIRGIALKEFELSQRWRVVGREVALAFVNGLAISIITGLVTFALTQRAMYGVVISAAMMANMVAAGFSGAFIPILLKAFGRDPAQSSSIILTTVTDVVGLAAFLGLGTLLMGYLA
jgi:magnesium transporter